jgi:hypothetical protein
MRTITKKLNYPHYSDPLVIGDDTTSAGAGWCERGGSKVTIYMCRECLASKRGTKSIPDPMITLDLTPDGAEVLASRLMRMAQSAREMATKQERK